MSTKRSEGVTLDNFLENLAREMAKVEKDPAGYVEASKPPPVGNPITLGERVASSDKWAAKQVANAKAGANAWLENSLRPKKVPSKAALDAQDKYVDKMTTSLNEKRWQGAMGKVNEDVRLQVIQNVGASGFSQGVERHTPKVENAVKDLQPRVLALAKTLDGMPQKTDADREAKMIAAKRGMQAIGKARK